jgi:hypothetical protein
MIVASWLLSLDPKHAATAAAALAAPNRQLRHERGSRRLILLTESDLDIPELQQELLATRGVVAADPIASFDDETEGCDLVRWVDAARQSCASNGARP